ncbi:uncharacterized protein TNCV_3566591 [Trichonephila clavipes]|nr:uncharacterized protein TNCV_3566591 [Trichonephila clavipes]
MQDGKPQVNRRVKHLLKQHFTEARLISRHIPTIQPPSSPDITLCDFWLWGFLKDNIWRQRPSILDLKDSIRPQILDIPADPLRLPVENMVLQLRAYN